MRLGRHVFAQADTPFPCGNKGVHLTYLDFCLLKRSTKRLQESLSRQDAKNAKKTFLLGALCAFARDTVFPISFSNIFG